MDTLSRLAGVTETSDLTNQPSHPIPRPPPIPADDDDAASNSPHLSHRASRASLPLDRQLSRKSLRNNGKTKHTRDAAANGTPIPHPVLHESAAATNNNDNDDNDEGEDDDDDDGFTWGPSHPCYPHQNPHCDPSGPERRTTRVIRVRRDLLRSGDLYPQYDNLYPEILAPAVTDGDFRALVGDLNARLRRALDPFSARAGLDALASAATGALWDDFGLSASARGLAALERAIDAWNEERVRLGREVRLVQLRRTGFMSLDFVVPVAGLDVVLDLGEEGGGGGAGGGIGPAA